MKPVGTCTGCDQPARSGKTQCARCAKQHAICARTRREEKKQLNEAWFKNRKFTPTVPSQQLLGTLI